MPLHVLNMYIPSVALINTAADADYCFCYTSNVSPHPVSHVSSPPHSSAECPPPFCSPDKHTCFCYTLCECLPSLMCWMCTSHIWLWYTTQQMQTPASVTPCVNASLHSCAECVPRICGPDTHRSRCRPLFLLQVLRLKWVSQCTSCQSAPCQKSKWYFHPLSVFIRIYCSVYYRIL